MIDFYCRSSCPICLAAQLQIKALVELALGFYSAAATSNEISERSLSINQSILILQIRTRQLASHFHGACHASWSSFLGAAPSPSFESLKKKKKKGHELWLGQGQVLHIVWLVLLLAT